MVTMLNTLAKNHTTMKVGGPIDRIWEPNFHRDHTWQYSEALARKFFEGDTMTVQKVSRETARKALKHITGLDRDFTETEIIQ